MLRLSGLILGSLLAGAAFAQGEKAAAPAGSAVKVDSVVIAVNVEDRKPVGGAEEFKAGVGKLVCWTKVSASKPPTAVTHVWYYKDKEMARVRLEVRDSSWQTWSRKTIQPSWAGDWRVDVLDEDGAVLKSASFKVVAG